MTTEDYYDYDDNLIGKRTTKYDIKNKHIITYFIFPEQAKITKIIDGNKKKFMIQNRNINRTYYLSYQFERNDYLIDEPK